MEMAGKQLSQFMELLVQPRLTVCATASYGLWKWLASSYPNLWNCLCNRVLQFVQLRLTAYGNGWQAVIPIYGTVCATASYSLCNRVLQFVQLRLTAYGNGWQAVIPIYGTACATASYSLCNHVLQFVQLRLTAYGNGWQAVIPFMETVLEVVRAKISGYIKS
jgi:hypothetical protein